MTSKIDARQVKNKAQGRWLELFPMIDSRLKGAVSSNGRGVPCPLGTGQKDGFRIPTAAALDGHAFHNQLATNALSDGFKVLMWLNDWTFYEALKAVNSAVNDETTTSATSKRAPAKQKVADYSKRATLFKRWIDESSTIPNRPAIRYYIERGLLDAPAIKAKSLRYIDAIPYRHDNGQYLKNADNSLFTTPAILFGLKTDNKIIGLSVIRIDSEGYKATDLIHDALEQNFGTGAYSVQPKQLLTIDAAVSGSCWRLGAVGAVWHVGEGAETMLAIAGALNTESVGACMTAALLENLEIPNQVKELFIWADKDRNERGLIAARKLQERASKSITVKVLTPPTDIPDGEKGNDWLDCQRDIKGAFRAC